MNKHGFTMLELMAVVVIVGVLVTIALPTYRVYIAKSRQGEAKINLAQIGKLQDLWKLEHGLHKALGPIGNGNPSGKCTDSDQSNVLGFRPKNCSELRYTYLSTLSEAMAESATSPDKKLIFPGCRKPDKWTYNLADGSFSQPGSTDNVINECK